MIAVISAGQSDPSGDAALYTQCRGLLLAVGFVFIRFIRVLSCPFVVAVFSGEDWFVSDALDFPFPCVKHRLWKSLIPGGGRQMN